MIPEFLPNGNLPPGCHPATWDEFVQRFGITDWRRSLIQRMRIALLSLHKAGGKIVYVDGSFVTAKENPGDFDACWVEKEINYDLLKKLEPTIVRYENNCAAQKAKYGGEFFPATNMATPKGEFFVNYFQTDKEGNPKGIVALDLESLNND